MQTFKNIIRNENYIHAEIKGRLNVRSACYLSVRGFVQYIHASYSSGIHTVFRGNVRATFGLSLAYSLCN